MTRTGSCNSGCVEQICTGHKSYEAQLSPSSSSSSPPGHRRRGCPLSERPSTGTMQPGARRVLELVPVLFSNKAPPQTAVFYLYLLLQPGATHTHTHATSRVSYSSAPRALFLHTGPKVGSPPPHPVRCFPGGGPHISALLLETRAQATVPESAATLTQTTKCVRACVRENKSETSNMSVCV